MSPTDEKVLFESTRLRDGREDLPNIVRVVEVEDGLLRVDTADSDDALHGEWWPLRGVGCQIVGRELLAQAERVRELEAEAEVGRRWAEDSSLERWFPLSVARIVTLEADNATLRGTLIETAKMQHEQMVAREERTKEWEAELAAIRPRAEAAERYAAAARALLEFTDNPPGTKDCWQVHDAAVLETQAAHDALLAACPEKGGAG